MDKLNQFGIISGNNCPLCNSEPESINHLFFECSYVRYVWALCILKLGLSEQISVFSDKAKLIQTCFKSKSKTIALARLTLAAAV